MDWLSLLKRLDIEVDKILTKNYALVLSNNELLSIFKLYDHAINGRIVEGSTISLAQFAQLISLLRKVKILTIYGDKNGELCANQIFPVIFSGVSEFEFIGCSTESVSKLTFLHDQIIKLSLFKSNLKDIKDIDNVFHSAADSGSKNWEILKTLEIINGNILNVNKFPTCFESVGNIDLRNNSIVTADFSDLKKIFSLNLSCNNLLNVPTFYSLAKTTLIVLVLSNNQLKDLRGIEHLKNLKILYLCDNFLLNIESMTELNSLSSLNELKLSGNPICYVSGYRIKVCSILPLSLMRSKNFRLDNRELSYVELRHVGTHPCTLDLISSLSVRNTLIENINTHHFSNDFGAKPQNDTQDFQILSDIHEQKSPYDSIMNLQLHEIPISSDSQNTEKETAPPERSSSSTLCTQEVLVQDTNPVSFTENDENKSDDNKLMAQSSSVLSYVKGGNSFSKIESGYYTVNRLDLERESDQPVAFVKIINQELVEFSIEMKPISELDLRYLFSFEFNEKFILKMGFQLQNPLKKNRSYLIQENQQKFNVLCRKLSLYNRNYKRKLSNQQTLPNSIQKKCPNCKLVVDSNLLTVCPECNSLLSYDIQPDSITDLSIDITKIIYPDSINKIDRILKSFLEARLVSNSDESINYLLKCWYVEKNVTLYSLCLLIISNLKFCVLKINNTRIQTCLNSILEVIHVIPIEDIKKITIEPFFNVLKISKIISNYTFIPCDPLLLSSLIAQLEIEFKQPGHFPKLSIEISKLDDSKYLQHLSKELKRQSQMINKIKSLDGFVPIYFSTPFYYDKAEQTFSIISLYASSLNLFFTKQNHLKKKPKIRIIYQILIENIKNIELYENNPCCIGITFLKQFDDEKTELLILLFPSTIAVFDLMSVIKEGHKIKSDILFQQIHAHLNQSINQKALSNTWKNHVF